MAHTVVVLSGGLDSTVLFCCAMREWFTNTDKTEEKVQNAVTAVTLDYGQRHIREIDAAKKIVESLSAEHPDTKTDHVIVRIPNIGTALPSALTDTTIDVPHGHYAAPSMTATIVPNRNMIIGSIAAGIAVTRGADSVVLGVHAGDHPVYPDCRPEFVTALQDCARSATGTNLSITAPFVSLPKWKIAQIGDLIAAPMELTWSCYEGGERHCGRCGTCFERKEAFKLAKLIDPTKYMCGESD